MLTSLRPNHSRSISKSHLILSCLILIGASAGLQAKTETYTIDPAHSSVEFRIGHFFSKVSGRFGKFGGTILVDRDAMEHSIIKAEIEAVSIDTNNETRDKHLRSGDYFDAEKFPKLNFESKNWKRLAENEFDVAGDLTLHGVTRPVVLHVKSLGFGEAKKDAYVSGWEARTNIKRADFGITSGKPAVGEDVEIEINIEAKRN